MSEQTFTRRITPEETFPHPWEPRRLREEKHAAFLREARADTREMLAPAETFELLHLADTLEAGRFNGQYYGGPCGCLVGTVANLHYPGDPVEEEIASSAQFFEHWPEDYRKVVVEQKARFGATMTRPAEEFASRITPHQTPENDEYAFTLRNWILELVRERQAPA